MKIYIPREIESDISKITLEKILSYLNLEKFSYQIIQENRKGRFIRININKKNVYIILSRLEADGRNSFLNQYIATAISGIDETKKTDEDLVYVYLLYTGPKAKTPYMIDTYRMLKNLEISILNEDRLDVNLIRPYQNLSEWKSQRENRRAYNRANNSTYVLEDEDKYYIYGKSFGANGKETTLISIVVSQIAKIEKKSAHLYQVEDNSSKEITFRDRELLIKYGIVIEGDLIEKFIEQKSSSIHQTSRNQALFQYNLLNKYGAKKCIICSNSIEETIIASHIHRITDIDNSDLPWEEKCEQAIDSENGFWLCANHDKLFENGLIYFKSDILFVSNHISEFVESINYDFDSMINLINEPELKNKIEEFVKLNNNFLALNDFRIKDEYFSEKMSVYLRKHYERVKAIQ